LVFLLSETDVRTQKNCIKISQAQLIYITLSKYLALTQNYSNLVDEDNILDRIREILGGSSVNFSILEHQVNIKVQMEYFEFSKAHLPSEDHKEVISQEDKLYSEEATNYEKKALLVNLASIDKPEAYRVLERFSVKAPAELKDWAVMATQESRMLLETRLLDEQQVFISTGLGGKGAKLRYFVVIFSKSGSPFTSTQEKLIRSEFEFGLRRFHSEIEEISFINNYFTILALVPLSVQVRKPFQSVIDECNSLDSFIKSSFLITNVQVLSESEIYEVLQNPPEQSEEE
jgi:hypothetical protein